MSLKRKQYEGADFDYHLSRISDAQCSINIRKQIKKDRINECIDAIQSEDLMMKYHAWNNDAKETDALVIVVNEYEIIKMGLKEWVDEHGMIVSSSRNTIRDYFSQKSKWFQYQKSSTRLNKIKDLLDGDVEEIDERDLYPCEKSFVKVDPQTLTSPSFVIFFK